MKLDSLINFIHEALSLKRVLRKSYQTLGSGGETIAEHSFGVILIGYLLAHATKADHERVMKMCLFHDIVESRVGDSNKINRKYQNLLEDKALNDTIKTLPKAVSSEIKTLIKEFKSGKSLEAKLTREADILEQLFQEKHYYELGNKQSKSWMKHSYSRLKMQISKDIASKAIKSNSFDWWRQILQRNS